MPTPAERAAAGAAFLDENWPKLAESQTRALDHTPWYDRVDIRRFDVTSAFRCVLAYLGGHLPLELQSSDRTAYGNAIDALGLKDDVMKRVLLGFSCTSDEGEHLLTPAFRAEIIRRRETRYQTPA